MKKLFVIIFSVVLAISTLLEVSKFYDIINGTYAGYVPPVGSPKPSLNVLDLIIIVVGLFSAAGLALITISNRRKKLNPDLNIIVGNGNNNKIDIYLKFVLCMVTIIVITILAYVIPFFYTAFMATRAL